MVTGVVTNLVTTLEGSLLRGVARCEGDARVMKDNQHLGLGSFTAKHWVAWRAALATDPSETAAAFKASRFKSVALPPPQAFENAKAICDAAALLLVRDQARLSHDTDVYPKQDGALELGGSIVAAFANGLWLKNIATEPLFLELDFQAWRRYWVTNPAFLEDIVRYLYRPSLRRRSIERWMAEVRKELDNLRPLDLFSDEMRTLLDLPMPRNDQPSYTLVSEIESPLWPGGFVSYINFIEWAVRRSVAVTMLDDPLFSVSESLVAAVPRFADTNKVVQEADEASQLLWQSLFTTIFDAFGFVEDHFDDRESLIRSFVRLLRRYTQSLSSIELPLIDRLALFREQTVAQYEPTFETAEDIRAIIATWPVRTSWPF